MEKLDIAFFELHDFLQAWCRNKKEGRSVAHIEPVVISTIMEIASFSELGVDGTPQKNASVAEKILIEEGVVELTQARLGRYLGLSRPRISQMVKEGCPLDNLETAKVWLRKYYAHKKGVRCREQLTDGYVAGVMRVPVGAAPMDLIEAKRAHIKLHRVTKEQEKENGK